MNTGRRTFSPQATNTGKNNRRISTFHSSGGALCLSLCRSFLWILYTFIMLALGLGLGLGLVRLRIRVRVRVRVSAKLKVSITWQNKIIMVAFYIMLARPMGRFFTVLRMNCLVMLIAEDICGLRLGLCRYADIGIGLAPLVCPYL